MLDYFTQSPFSRSNTSKLHKKNIGILNFNGSGWNRRTRLTSALTELVHAQTSKAIDTVFSRFVILSYQNACYGCENAEAFYLIRIYLFFYHG